MAHDAPEGLHRRRQTPLRAAEDRLQCPDKHLAVVAVLHIGFTLFQRLLPLDEQLAADLAPQIQGAAGLPDALIFQQRFHQSRGSSCGSSA